MSKINKSNVKELLLFETRFDLDVFYFRETSETSSLIIKQTFDPRDLLIRFPKRNSSFWRGLKTRSEHAGLNRGSFNPKLLVSNTQAEQSFPHRLNNSVRTLFKARLFKSEVNCFS
ncbi:hypothetical protein CEXT_754211 [Caerostris extrusa]|uniref:Uncharacterized protein n=1 Tax=Caerostris extrusa TaxID=172846 RepID=A0AAV4MST6_CAEEX|nr:hypothetical protein CEXT_754211 [Caerostris extrusa]